MKICLELFSQIQLLAKINNNQNPRIENHLKSNIVYVILFKQINEGGGFKHVEIGVHVILLLNSNAAYKKQNKR